MHRCYCIVLISILLIKPMICKENVKCMVKLDLSVCYSTEPANVTSRDCNEAAICQKQFNISYIDQKPYSSEIVSDILRTCCGPCAKTLRVNTVTKVSQLTPSIMDMSHFIFPVLGRVDTTSLFGYRFIPLIETPNVYYITRKRNNLMQELIISCLRMWPLMIVCALMVTISGFICWIIDTWVNEEQFPRSFLLGWFEGIWWSFISMTTVGYGDKAPKSGPARLLCVIWIVVGITTFSLVTATLTSEIFAANALPPPKMTDANVGAIHDHLYEAILIATQGGILINIEHNNITDGIQKLIHMLDTKEIDGFVLDRYELMLFYNFYKDDINHKHDVHYLRMNTVLTEVIHTERYFYGILVKNEEDYEFLEDFVTSNRDVTNSCTNLFLSNYSRSLHVQQEKTSLFSTDGQTFWPSFIICAIVIGVIFIFGATYELRKRIRPGKHWYLY